MKRITKGFLLGPLVVPALVSIGYILIFLFYSTQFSIGKVLGLLIFCTVATLAAYLYTGLVGVPAYRLLKRFDMLKLRYILAISFLLGMTFEALFSLGLPIHGQGVLVFSIFGIFGMAVGYAIWFIGIREKP